LATYFDLLSIEEIVQELDKRVSESDAEILEFFREIVAIPRMNSDIEKTGAILFYEKYFPAWTLAEDHPFVEAGKQTRQNLWGTNGSAGKWDFSTNGNYWCGKMGIPSIGFGPVTKSMPMLLMNMYR